MAQQYWRMMKVYDDVLQGGKWRSLLDYVKDASFELRLLRRSQSQTSERLDEYHWVLSHEKAVLVEEASWH
jgi:hypothetical protein